MAAAGRTPPPCRKGFDYSTPEVGCPAVGLRRWSPLVDSVKQKFPRQFRVRNADVGACLQAIPRSPSFLAKATADGLRASSLLQLAWKRLNRHPPSTSGRPSYAIEALVMAVIRPTDYWQARS
jgi:hypothetical protein